MTRVLIIGNSHVAALKKAESAFSLLYPDIELFFFAVSEPYFGKGRASTEGVYTPPEAAFTNDKIIETESGGSVIFSNYDHVFAVGLRTPLNILSEILSNYNILEGGAVESQPLISESFLKRNIQIQVRETLFNWMKVLGQEFLGTISPVPFPSSAILASTRRVDRRARASLTLHRHADAALIFNIWRAEMETQMLALSATLFWQPEKTVHAPFVSKEAYAAADYAHMNADFGLLLLTTYATEVLQKVARRIP